MVWLYLAVGLLLAVFFIRSHRFVMKRWEQPLVALEFAIGWPLLLLGLACWHLWGFLTRHERVSERILHYTLARTTCPSTPVTTDPAPMVALTQSAATITFEYEV